MHPVLLHDGALGRIRALSRRHGLPVIGTSWSANLWDRSTHAEALSQARTVIERLASVGGRTLGICVGDARRKKTRGRVRRAGRRAPPDDELCADHGVVPNLHNHVYEVRDGEHDLNGTLERIPESSWDPTWAGCSAPRSIRSISSAAVAGMVFAHLRNEKADGKWPETLAEGVIDYTAIGKLLHEIGFAGDLVIELAHERDFEPTRRYGESVRLSRDYVRRVMQY